jgi:transcriptional regulator with XRE-family HTH domain
MIRLRKILAANMKAFRAELGYSQAKVADIIDSATNYIAMIETEKRFPTDTMLEKIATALEREPHELFSPKPIQKEWQEQLIADIQAMLHERLEKIHR